jgi:hypothetical protein
MHRLCRLAAVSGLVLASLAATGQKASAALIRNPADRAFPDISANINGVVNYVYDPTTQTGNFHVTNTPYLIAGGPTADQEFAVNPNASDGVRQQILNVTLDSQGNLVQGGINTYSLYGTINAGGQTFSGLLLQGTPTKFGSLDLGSAAQGMSVFDLEMNITGGALAKYFGPDAYMRIVPELNSTFQGRFDQNFSAIKATSNTRAYHSPQPFPIPEPTTLLIVLLGGAGVVYRHRSRLRRGHSS